MKLEDYNAMNNVNRDRSSQTRAAGVPPPKYTNGAPANGQHRSTSGNRSMPTNRISFNSVRQKPSSSFPLEKQANFTL